MKKILKVLVILVLAFLLVALIARGCSGESGAYQVRAVFDNGAFVVPAVDVRVAGANVGNVDSIDVSQPGEKVSDDPERPDRPGKAIVVMNITDTDFQDFREDASCIIRPQSLIGEKFLDCSVTEPRPPGTEPPPALEKVPEGQPGAGQYLLPLENNARTIDQDLINNIYRLPYAQRFRIILNELGAGLATRGPELREIITRGNPTLREVNKVLKILSDQNKRLAQLARNSDNNLTKLAAKRRNMVGFFRNAGYTAGATAERSEDMKENLRNLPTTLRELRATFRALDTFASDARPTFEALRPNAKQIAEVTKKLEPFAKASQISFESLGEATRTARPDLLASRPIIAKLGDQARSGKEPFTDLRFFFESTRQAKGFRNLMRFFYNTGSALSGYDQYGHYQRTNVIITGCTEYKLARFSNCPTQWDFTRSARMVERMAEEMPQLEQPGEEPEVPEELPGDEEVPDSDEETPVDPSTQGGSGDQVPGLGPEQIIPGTGSAGRSPAGNTADSPVAGRRRGLTRAESLMATRMKILDYLVGE